MPHTVDETPALVSTDQPEGSTGALPKPNAFDTDAYDQVALSKQVLQAFPQ